MITNLFSVFDPSSSILSLTWAIIPLILIVSTSNPWNTSPTIILTNNKILSFLFSEVLFTLKNTSNSQVPIILTIFILILIINITALYPQVFSLTSQLVITLPLSFLIWLTIVSFGWINNTNHILSHLLPQGTPLALISFIVIIELTSNIIRPITLCVRLTANLIAGHLLLSLLGNSLINISFHITLLTIILPILLTILESAVAFIQAYVFITLITLYITEVN